MEKSRRMVASVLLCVLATELCLGQHWSFGLQPGGKRSPQGPFLEVANEMEKLEEPGWSQNSRIRDLKEVMERLLEGEGRRKI
ncbi:progonadoliberin-1 [Catharus ustulatus]|uniref:Gonadoliberin n=1 Tax=Catharus ustulatus TaxID=91951 RepID=A0A8C3U6H2_CATUS|nr:progonadoliberin-1 [Catharus ustulatus]